MAAAGRISARRSVMSTGSSKKGSLERLGGVLYFTDGYGVFPEEPPPYPAAFVMLQYRCDDINIPRWAKTLVLDAEKPGSEEQWI